MHTVTCSLLLHPYLDLLKSQWPVCDGFCHKLTKRIPRYCVASLWLKTKPLRDEIKRHGAIFAIQPLDQGPPTRNLWRHREILFLLGLGPQKELDTRAARSHLLLVVCSCLCVSSSIRALSQEHRGFKRAFSSLCSKAHGPVFLAPAQLMSANSPLELGSWSQMLSVDFPNSILLWQSLLSSSCLPYPGSRWKPKLQNKE